ncbi:SufS family cysteine desulfurase [bacterium]|nr:SufS family cysteine desulfurase [bacterium]
MSKFMKELFPVFKKNKDLVYLDSAASSMKPQKVIDAINDYYLNYSVNIERGVYNLALNATKRVEESRKKIAEYIGANSKEIIFTRGASNSLNMVALMLKKILKPGDEVITSELEHHSSFLPFLNLQKEIGIKLVFVPLEADGRITIDNFKKVLSNKTKVVALTHVSNVLGYKTDVKEIIRLSHEVGAITSIDGAQASPHMKLDMKDLDTDFYSFSFHKMCGPTGLGILYGKKELLEKLDPVELGGEMNDEVTKNSVTYKDLPYKFETGTMPIAEIFASGATIDFLSEIGIENIEKESIRLRNLALKELLKLDEIEVYNKNQESSIIAFNIKGVHSHDLVSVLAENNIAVRAGHHCAEPLHRFLKISASTRASFYFYNDESDVSKFLDVVKKTISFFREVGYID